jgi:glycosyltransferase involved in cell wall biosynthesis
MEIRDMPILALKKIAVLTFAFWYLASDLPKSILTGVLQIPILLVAVLGTIKTIRLWYRALVLLVPVIGITFASVVILAFARLSTPVMPFLIGIAVFGLWPQRWCVSQGYPAPVLQTITRLIVGGAQETVMYIAALMDKDRFQVDVLSGPQTGSEGSLIEELRTRGIPLTILPDMVRQISLLHDPLALLKMTRLIQANRYTVVHTNSSKAGIIGRVAARIAGTPIIVHTVHGWSFHDHMDPWLKKIYTTLERFAASFTDALVVVTDRDIDKGLQEGIGRPEQYHLIRSAIPLDEFDPQRVSRETVRKELGIPLDAPVLGNVGRFSVQKNPLDWVKVAALVAKEMPECHFLLVGDGPLRLQVETLIAENNLNGQTIHTGLRRDVPEMLSAIDVFLLTSLWEGLPRVIPQAMAMQVPVVANHVDGSAEAIIHGETGCLCAPGDLDDLAANCLLLLQDENLRTEMGKKGRFYAIQEFDVHRMVSQLTTLYEDLLERKSC